METLICKCSQCNIELGRFINLWTQVGKSYVTPIVAPDESRTISTKGPTRVGDQNTLVSGCQLQDIACTNCDSVLGLKCCYSPVNHVLENNQFLLRLASVRLVSTKGGRDAKLNIKRFLKLKDPVSSTGHDAPGPDPSGPHVHGGFVPPQSQRADYLPQFNPVDLTGLQAYLESQRADISRIDTAGLQIVAAFDSAMDRVEREVKKLQDTMAALRRDLEGNRDDVSSLKANVDAARKDSRAASDKVRTLGSEVQDIRKNAPSKDVVDGLQQALSGLRQSSLDHASEAKDLRRELGLAKGELNRMKDDQAALRKQVDNLKRTSKETPTVKDYAREVSALRVEIRQLRQETAQKTPSHTPIQNNSFPTKELDILTRNITKIGNRASQIETLQMEFQLFKSRLQRLEAPELEQPEPPARGEYDPLQLSDDESEQQSATLATSMQKRKRLSASRGKVGESATPNKRLALSPDTEEQDPDVTSLGLLETSPLESAARGRGTAKRARGSTDRKVRGVGEEVVAGGIGGDFDRGKR